MEFSWVRLIYSSIQYDVGLGLYSIRIQYDVGLWLYGVYICIQYGVVVSPDADAEFIRVI